MTLFEQIAGTIAAAVVGGIIVHLWKENRAKAAKGRQMEEHAGLVTVEQCKTCRENLRNDLLIGNGIFRLLIEGNTLFTEALIYLCRDEGCARLRERLHDHVNRLAQRPFGGRDAPK